VFGAETTLNGICRAELAAGVAPNAVIFVDVNNPAQLTLAQIAFVGATVLTVCVFARPEGVDRHRILEHGHFLRSRKNT